MDFKVATEPPKASRSKYQPAADACAANPHTWYETPYNAHDYQGLRARGLHVLKRGDLIYFKWDTDEEG